MSNGATITCLGNTNAINAASGGAPGNPHGVGVTIDAMGNVLISGTITANEQGFNAERGPGRGLRGGYGDYYCGGGGYGGRGGDAEYGYLTAKNVYGSATAPTALGSGGGSTGHNPLGGGAIKINAAGATITVNGTLSANGRTINDDEGGVGSGGSIWLIANTLAGSGSIQAKGGYNQHNSSPSDGGGGRIRLEYSNRTFNGTISAKPGTRQGSKFPPHAGTVSFPDGEDLIVKDDIALMPGTYHVPNLIVTNSAILWCRGDRTVINEAAGGVATNPHGAGVTIIANGITICAGAAIGARGMGFSPYSGPGVGSTSGGAGYGGDGGNGSPKGSAYGSLTAPSSLGSGGMSPACCGGGAIALDATNGTITLNGIISSIGDGVCYDYDSRGCGSGGSIWLIAGTLSGSGTILAKGGQRLSYTETVRGGGGGRIGIQYRNYSNTLSSVTAPGGTGGGANGQTGTVYYCQMPAAGWEGLTLGTAFSTNSNGVIITRVINKWKVVGALLLSWNDTSTDVGGGSLSNNATYTVSGLEPSLKCSIFVDGVYVNSRTSSGSGALTTDPVALGGTARTITIQAGSGMMVTVR